MLKKVAIVTVFLAMSSQVMAEEEPGLMDRIKGDAAKAWESTKEMASDAGESISEGAKTGWEKTKEFADDPAGKSKSLWEEIKEKADKPVKEEYEH